MTNLTVIKIEQALENANLESLLNEVINSEDDLKSYGLSFNVESYDLKFIPYIHNEDKSWVSCFESQNPCIIIGFINYNDCLMGDPASDIIENLKYNMIKD